MHHKRCIGPLPSIQLSSTWISLTGCAGTARVCSSALIAHSFLTRSPCASARVVTRGGIELYYSAQAFRHVVSVDTNNVLRFDRSTGAPKGVFAAAPNGVLQEPIYMTYINAR